MPASLDNHITFITAARLLVVDFQRPVEFDGQAATLAKGDKLRVLRSRQEPCFGRFKRNMEGVTHLRGCSFADGTNG